jgi:iron(III) transport system substrate-binding protein
METVMITRRQALAGAALATVAHTARAAGYEPPGTLVDAARKEGRVVMYTASFTEVEQETAAEFNKRFPFVKLEIIRASGGQLITRVKTEASAGKLVADIVDHSDRGLMNGIEDLFIDYAPPNAADYLPGSRISDKFWPRITPVWCLAYNTELVKTPPKTWMDLTDAKAWPPGTIGQVIAPSGGTTWTRILFERQVLGEDYWTKQAAAKPTLYPSSAPAGDAVIRGEVQVAPVIRNVIFPKQKDGAPVELVFPTEGIPVVPYASGIPKSSVRPNAARLFLDWNLSEAGQAFTMTQQGNLTSLKTPSVTLAGYDPKTSKIWLPANKDFETLASTWIPEWNKIYGYRQ